jgi:hypothetical protein
MRAASNFLSCLKNQIPAVIGNECRCLVAAAASACARIGGRERSERSACSKLAAAAHRRGKNGGEFIPSDTKASNATSTTTSATSATSEFHWILISSLCVCMCAHMEQTGIQSLFQAMCPLSLLLQRRRVRRRQQLQTAVAPAFLISHLIQTTRTIS